MDWECIYHPDGPVKVNVVFSELITISNGTGLPFIADTVRSHPGTNLPSRVRLNDVIRGPRMGTSHYKVSAYADDLMFSLSNPLPHCLNSYKNLGNTEPCQT